MTAELRSHTFDGIQEFDNRLPNWWLWTFYLAVIFSVFYWVHYHTLGTGNQPMDDYIEEQRVAAAKLEAELAKNPITDEALLDLASKESFVAEGKAYFLDPMLCMQCHKANASGDIGPNLTDEFWIYGGKPTDIYTTIMHGRPGGMAPYKSKGLGFVLRVTAYVLSLKNTNVPGKKPEKNAKKEQ